MKTEIDLKLNVGNNFHNTLTGEQEIPYFIGFIPAQDLINNFEIPYSDTINGYQRAPGKSRVNKFAKKIYDYSTIFSFASNCRIRFTENYQSNCRKFLSIIRKYNSKIFSYWC